jgi:hypothetical protein
MEALAGLPSTVQRYLAAVTERIVDTLNQQLVGVYTTGSLALGGYYHGRSDIDLMAVTDPISDGPVADLVTRLDHRVLPCPASGLEFVLYPRAVVSSTEPVAGYLLNLNTGAQLPAKVNRDPSDDQAFWYVLDRSITYQAGHALHGPAPRRLLRPMPFQSLLPVVIESVVSARANPSTDLLDNAVLNGCRALRFATDRIWQAKLPAAKRTVVEAPEFRQLIESAIQAFGRGRHGGSSLSANEVAAFQDEVLRRMHAIRSAAR